MALLLNSGVHLVANSAVVSAAPLTMACWFNAASLHTGVLLSISDASSANRSFHLTVRNNGTVDGTAWNVTAGAAVAANTYTPGAWTQVAFVCRSSTDRSIYLNGSSRGDDTTPVTPFGLDTTAVGGFIRAGSLFGVADTQIAEVAVWSAALTDEEVTELALGRSSVGLTHRLSELRLYDDFLRPSGRRRLGPSLTASGEPSASPHPRVWLPGRQQQLGRRRLRGRLFANARQVGVAGAASALSYTTGASAGGVLG